MKLRKRIRCFRRNAAERMDLMVTIKDISKELQVSESFVKNNIYRTLKELQELIRKDCD